MPAAKMRYSPWLQALRWPFLVAMLVPVVLGAVLAYHLSGQFNLWLFAQAVLAALGLHAAANVLNDVRDAETGADYLNSQPLTPFAGGSRVIQQARLSVQRMRQLGWALALFGVLLGLGLVWQSGAGLFWLGLLGVVIGLGYSAGPYPLNYHGWGEVAIFLCFGPMAVSGSVYTQLGYFPVEGWLLGLVTGLLIMAIVLVNELPDFPADKRAGKQTWVVLLGETRARWLLLAVLLCAFLVLLIGAVLALWPQTTLLALLALPVAIMGWWQTPLQEPEPLSRVPGIKKIVLTPVLVMLLLTIGTLL